MSPVPAAAATAGKAPAPLRPHTPGPWHGGGPDQPAHGLRGLRELHDLPEAGGAGEAGETSESGEAGETGKASESGELSKPAVDPGVSNPPGLDGRHAWESKVGPHSPRPLHVGSRSSSLSNAELPGRDSPNAESLNAEMQGSGSLNAESTDSESPCVGSLNTGQRIFDARNIGSNNIGSNNIGPNNSGAANFVPGGFVASHFGPGHFGRHLSGPGGNAGGTLPAGSPRRRGTGAALLGLLAGVVAGLLTFAPARWLAAALGGLTERVQLQDAHGTVWQGSARVWLMAGPGSPDRRALPQRLSWSLTPHWQGLHLGLRAECCMTEPALLRLAWSGRLALDDMRSVWPAPLLQGLGAPWNTLQPSGQLALSAQGLSITLGGAQPRIEGSVILDVLDLGSALSTLQPLGSYRIRLHATGDAPQLHLQTLRGDLQLSGQGQWLATGLRFQGEASAAPGREDALANVLNIIGRRDGARSLISLG